MAVFATGQVTSAVTGLYPWIGFKPSEKVTVWTMAGYGAGGLMLQPGEGRPIETGMSMAMAAGGGRGELVATDAGLKLAFKADALWVGTRDGRGERSGREPRVDPRGGQPPTDGDRGLAEPHPGPAGWRSSRAWNSASGKTPVTRKPAAVSTSAWVSCSPMASRGWRSTFGSGRLLVHQAPGFAESGILVSVSYDPTPDTPLGLRARVSPAWGGDAMSSAEALWSQETMGGMGGMNDPRLAGVGGSRLDTEVGYGRPIGRRFVGTPRVGVRTSEYGQDYRLGYGVEVLEEGPLRAAARRRGRTAGEPRLRAGRRPHRRWRG